jgi:hypothetical protein
MQGLQGSGIDALIGQGVAAGMPEHVRESKSRGATARTERADPHRGNREIAV